MATNFSHNGIDYEIEVTGAPVGELKDRHGNEVFMYYASVRRKGDQAWRQLQDVGGKRPFLNSSAERVREVAKEFIENNEV